MHIKVFREISMHGKCYISIHMTYVLKYAIGKIPYWHITKYTDLKHSLPLVPSQAVVQYNWPWLVLEHMNNTL